MTTILIDSRNVDLELPKLLEALRNCTSLVGIDCETQDDARHEGLNRFMSINEVTRAKPSKKKLVFDYRRTVVTGFSIYPEGQEVRWYLNLAHADVENRLPRSVVDQVLDARHPSAVWVAHNAAYELSVFKSCFDRVLEPIVCTMQLSVTAFGDDNYPRSSFINKDLGGMYVHVEPLMKAMLKTKPVDLEGEEGETRKFSREVDDLIGKITAKDSDGAASYNGWVDTIAYGHGLKSLIKKLFDYDMTTFEEVMNGRGHMGMMTGEEVVAYGADDAYWVIPLFRKLLEMVAISSPNALNTFFEQENPMVQIFSDLQLGGLKINHEAVLGRQKTERSIFAQHLRDLKVAIKAALPFDTEPNSDLIKYRQDWYERNYAKYREKLTRWANSPDSDDDFEQCLQVSSPVSNAWAAERGDPRRKSDLSISHYMPVRVMLYDLLKAKLVFDKGKLASDAEARGKCQDWLQNNGGSTDLTACLTKMAGVEQRMKLYITPYLCLVDPETERMYPSINSLLNTRRLAASSPNATQLAKRGDSTYIRGFFLPDHDDHVIVSLDWSSFELVIIGELSKDPEFHKAYFQLPHQDLHSGAAADILRVDMEWLTEGMFMDLKRIATPGDFYDKYGISEDRGVKLFTNLKGELMDPSKAQKYWRTEVGKGGNFNYWYSGWLTTVGDRMGWSWQKMAAATENYRSRFSVAEDWRVGVINQGKLHGWVELPDGHRRFRYEAMPEWRDIFMQKWGDIPELYNPINEVARRIQVRAGNQMVNAMVQGTNAFVLKRSIIRLLARLKAMGWSSREARFMMPIHDEIVFSVHRSLINEFIREARQVMMSHDDIFPTLKLDATPSVGLTFEPWSSKSATIGQVELFEAPAFDFLPETSWNGRLNDNEVDEVVNHLFRARAA